MAAGDALGRLLAKKKRMKPGAYFAAITAFQDKFPG